MPENEIATLIRGRVSRALGLRNGAAAADTATLAAGMLARADAARDGGDFRGAAVLYDEALRLSPGDAGAHVQCGHMFKETGDLARAEAHYAAALRLTPDDPDLSLQLGHFYKVAGRLRASAAAYARAAALMPTSAEPALELARLHAAGWRADPGETLGPQIDLAGPRATDPFPSFEIEAVLLPGDTRPDRLAAELVPTPIEELLYPHGDGSVLNRFGRQEPSRWGVLATFRGVEAIRGFCNAGSPLTAVTISLNGIPIHVEPLKPGRTLDYNTPDSPVRKYVFNAWCDFSEFVRGRHILQLRFTGPNAAPQTREVDVVIADPLPEAEFAASDAIISLPATDPRPIDEQVNARPSVIRPARRKFFAGPIRTVLILRTDQLGDMVASIPAMERLREMLPDVRFVGLMTSSNVDFANTLGLFDEIIPLTFPDDYFQRRRIMSLEAQDALRRQLEPYRFDIAIDLAEAKVSRPLLRLSGARYLCGFHDEAFPWLTVGFTAATHDPGDGREMAAHSSAVLAFVERIGALLDTRAKVVRRPELTRDGLATYGIGPSDRFAVLHTGARIAFNRWPSYYELAGLILKNTSLKVVLLTEDPAMRAQMPAELAQDRRFQLMDEKLPFDDFDALLSFCTVFAGNDSGPKHLAGLRGANVVSIHSARVNWNDWGQELTGSIISRKVPCAGCQIYYEADECGKDAVCITRITPEEVFAEMTRFI